MTTQSLPRLAIRLSGGIEPRRCIALAEVAEASGFASVWFAENPFQRGVFPIAGACAAATSQLRLGLGVVNPFTRHPVQIAMEFASLDELSEGRGILGIGSGIAPPIRRMGIRNDRRIAAVREAMGIVRALLAGESVSRAGTVFGVDNGRLARPPLRTDPPIYLAAAGERGLDACAALADGLIISNLTPLRSTVRMLRLLDEAAAKAGRPRPAVVQYVPCVVRSDATAARQAVKAAIGEMLTSFWPVGDDWPPVRETIVAESGIPRGDFAGALDRLRRGEKTASALDDRFVAAFAIAGTAEECLDQAACYRAAGVDEIALTFAGAQPEVDIAYLGRALAAL